MSEAVIATFCYVFVFWFSLILQGIGIFTDHWIVVDINGTDCKQSVVELNKCTGDGGRLTYGEEI